jgi:hypothetical protein
MTHRPIVGRKRHVAALEALYVHYSLHRRPAAAHLPVRWLMTLPLVSVVLGAATIAGILIN